MYTVPNTVFFLGSGLVVKPNNTFLLKKIEKTMPPDVTISFIVQTFFIYSTNTVFFLWSDCESNPIALGLAVKPHPTTLFN
jgi:hypothetical protein